MQVFQQDQGGQLKNNIHHQEPGGKRLQKIYVSAKLEIKISFKQAAGHGQGQQKYSEFIQALFHGRKDLGGKFLVSLKEFAHLTHQMPPLYPCCPNIRFFYSFILVEYLTYPVRQGPEKTKVRCQGAADFRLIGFKSLA
ncbi:MAG: hypothetical protein ACO1O1_08405 [Adhaeribacter sp.]